MDVTDRESESASADRPPAAVFFSYSRDDQAQALPIIRLIEQAGFAIWWDGLLEGGERFSRATEAALNSAKVVVVLWSRTAVQSHWVHDEATRGRDRGILVPLSLDGVEPPLGFGQFQVINLAHAKMTSQDPDVQKMLRAIGAVQGAPLVALPVSKAKTPRISRRAALGGGLALAAVGGGTALWKSGILRGGPVPHSVAVLPFANLSGDPAQRYFSDGLASEIRLQLSRNTLLSIIGQTSSNQFRDHEGDSRSIAQDLRVTHLLDGNVQRSGNIVKIATDLIDGKTGLSKWAQTFERQLSDIFAVQSEIAGAVAAALAAVMDAGEKGAKKTHAGGTQSLAAFDAFLRAQDLYESHVDENSDKAALVKCEQAIAIDPDYAAARSLRARTLAVIANENDNAEERKSLYSEAVAEARRATVAAPDFAGGFAALGYALFYGRLDAKAARAPYDRALALGQGDADVLSRYAVFCARTGRFDEATKAIQRAIALDPLNATLFKSAGNIQYAAKAYDEAIPLTQKALALSPKRSTLHGDIGNALLMLGKLDDAQAEFALETNTLLSLPGKAIIAHRRGDIAQSNAGLSALAEEYGDNGLYQQAQILAQQGKPDPAFAALSKAREAADSGLVYLLNDPLLEPLRGDPRYTDLLKLLNFV